MRVLSKSRQLRGEGLELKVNDKSLRSFTRKPSSLESALKMPTVLAIGATGVCEVEKERPGPFFFNLIGLRFLKCVSELPVFNCIHCRIRLGLLLMPSNSHNMYDLLI